MQPPGPGPGAAPGLSPSPEVPRQNAFRQFLQAYGIWPALSVPGVRSRGAPGGATFDRAAKETPGSPEQAGGPPAPENAETAQAPVDVGDALRLRASQLRALQCPYQGRGPGQEAAPRSTGQGPQGPLRPALRSFGTGPRALSGIGTPKAMAVQRQERKRGSGRPFGQRRTMGGQAGKATQRYTKVGDLPYIAP